MKKSILLLGLFLLILVAGFILMKSMNNIEADKIDENNTTSNIDANNENGGVTIYSTVVKPGNSFNVENGVLVGYSGNTSEVVIPNSVTQIDANVFENRSEIAKIIIPNTVLSIGANAFSGCDCLKEVEISKSVTSIGENAFNGTPWLNNKITKNPIVIVNNILIDGTKCKGEVMVPDGVVSINDGAFYNNTNLISISLPDSVLNIGKEAFMSCINLQKVKMTNSVTIIQTEAFYRCNALKSIKLSNSIEKIESWAFEECYSLKCITLPEALKEIYIASFSKCKKLQHISVSGEVNNIMGEVFADFNSGVTFYSNQNLYISDFAKSHGYNYEELAINKTTANILVGQELKIHMNSYAQCDWKSSDDNVAAVNSSGEVTGISEGKAKIKATLYGKNYECTITVNQK